MGRSLSDDDRARLIALYEDRLDEFGNDVRTVGWGSREDQILRFDQLCREQEIKGRRILDVGCGLGDLVPYLDARSGGDFQYSGIDLSSRLVEQARVGFGGDNRVFYCGDILDPDFRDKPDMAVFDLVFLSGALSFRVDDNIAFAKSMIKYLFALCTETLSLNFLSTHVDSQENKNFHYDPSEMFAYAKSLTPWVTLYHDYPLWEFTLKMRRFAY